MSAPTGWTNTPTRERCSTMNTPAAAPDTVGPSASPTTVAVPVPVRLDSSVDASVNWIVERDDGKVESRYVRRSDEYFICYVSSHTGCNKGCRFCHLTQTAQTQMTALSLDEIVAQAEPVMAHYDMLSAQGHPTARVVHFNFMARGEAFANPHILGDGDEVVTRLAALGAARRLQSCTKFSTIFPIELDGVALGDIFAATQPDIYYSLYSTNPEFRRRWLPRALPHTAALAALADWQRVTRKVPVIHWAFIAGENDSHADIDAICAAVADAGLRVDVNIVRYNPYSDRQGAEPPEAHIAGLAARLRAGITGSRVQVVSRVGTDVAASCGMFVGGRNPRVPLTGA